MASGGDCIEITVNHPTLGTHAFSPMAGEDSTYILGGIQTVDEDNSINGRGEPVYKMNRKRWSFEVPISWDKGVEDEILSQLHASPEEGTWTFANGDGTIYTAKGKPVSEPSFNGNSGQHTLKVSGGGKLEIIR